MKQILIFKNTDDFGYFGNYEAREKTLIAIENMERNGKTYMITIEEVVELD